MSRLLPVTTVTTRHAVAAYPWHAQPALPAVPGVVIGRDVLSGGAVACYDPWELYAAGVVTSPNMVVLGQLGTGKSALVKTYLARQAAAGRVLLVLDPKGEYAPLAAAVGVPLLRLAPGGAHRMNPLEPAGDEEPPALLAQRRAGVAAALAELGHGRPLTAEQRAGLTATCHELPVRATLPDLVDALHAPGLAVAAALRSSPGAVAGALREPALLLHRLAQGDLAGMLDAPTTVTLPPGGPGLVLDLSAVFGTEALPAVMLAAGEWLGRRLALDEPRRRLLLVDEAWALLAHPATTSWLQAVGKLARARGVQLITVVHRVSDLTGQADMGSAAREQARGLLADAATRVVYQQAAAERATAAALLDLTPAETELVTRLPARRALWRVGARTAVVDHLLAPGEHALVDTDTAMRP